MRGFVPLDPQSDVSQEHFVVIHAPKPNRKRFPAGCVEVVESKQIAIDAAERSEKFHAALVIGPSKSSEGQYIYYLVEWL